MRYNSTNNLNSYGGRNKWSSPIGTTRNSKGSANRMYQYCSTYSPTPLYCMYQLPKDYIKGFLSFSFVYTCPGTITENTLKQLLPVQYIPGIFEFIPNVTITGNFVYIEMETYLRKLPSNSYPNNVGFTFAAPPDISSLPPVQFFNDCTKDIIFYSAINLPFSKFGRQFENLVNTFKISSNFFPYFLPGTSLNSCFANCTNFNSNISNWDTSNVTDMSSMFSNTLLFNQPISSWDVSNVTDMETMFQGVDMNNPNSETNQDNYNALLNSWGTEPNLSLFKNYVTFDAGLSKYTISIAGTARSNLIGKGWIIYDGGGVSVPSAPTINTITQIDNQINNQITINFTVPTSDGGLPITSYKYSLDNGSTFTEVVTTISPIIVGGLAYSTTYKVIIRAVNSVGDGQLSTTVSITTPTVVPSAPTINTITQINNQINNQITINFTVPTSNGGATITSYKYSLDNGFTFTEVVTTTSPIIVTGLAYSTTYQVIIRAVNSVGNGTISNMKSVTTPTVAPLAPTITSITPTDNQIEINFDPPTSNGGATITDYKYSLDAGSTFISSGQTTSPIIVTGLAYNTTYQVIIRAVNSVGDGTPSSTVSVTSATVVPSEPTITSITQIYNEIIINFIVPSSDGGATINDYNYSLDAGSTFISSGQTTSPITVTGLDYNTTYQVIIRAVNSVGDGTPSSVEPVTISIVIPSEPTITSITPINNEIEINFDPPINNGGAAITNYNYSLDNGFTFIPSGQTTNPITVTGLAYSTTYQVIIRAVNSVGNGTISNMKSVTTPTVAPLAPTITSIIPTNNQIEINFVPPTSNGGATITDYKYSLDAGSTFISSGQTTSPIIVTGLDYNTTYQVIIRAVNSVGDGTPSSTVSVTSATVVPFAPTITSITPTNNQITINFDPPTSNGGATITDYNYSLDNGFTFIPSGQTTNPITVTGLDYNTTYQVIIRAVNSVGDGTQSNMKSVITPTIPSAPTITSVTPTNNQITINFTVPSSDGRATITSYKYSLNGSAFATAGQTTSPITVTGLDYNTTYEVIIRAVNSVGDGTQSNMVSVITPTIPSAPTITSVTPTNNQITINFTVPSSDGRATITSYKYSLNGSTFTTAGQTTSPITVTGLDYNTTYEVIIRAVNSVGDGTQSNMVSVITPTVPSAPTITSVTPTNNQIEINFTVPSSDGRATITSYKYSLNGSTFTTAGQTTSPITVTGLDYNTTYEVIIRAVNSVGDGTISNMVSVTTPITGSLNYSFTYTGTGLTQQLVIDNIPIKTLAGKFTITSSTISIVSTAVNVTIVTSLYGGSTTTEFGITFNSSNNSLTTFYNGSTSNLTFISSNNCPLSRNGFQFSGLTQAFSIQSGVVPYLLSGTSLNSCFAGCTNFNSNISNLDTTNVTDMTAMFYGATKFNQPINTSGNYWNTTNVTNMSNMFYAATAFNQNIGTWDTTNVTNMGNMFFQTSAFNNGETTNTGSNPLNWITSKVTNMGSTFRESVKFNQNIGTWDVSKVTNMYLCFEKAYAFNNGGSSTISSWSAPLCNNFEGMFSYAGSFNQPVTTLVNSTVGCTIQGIFSNASSFNNGETTNTGSNPLNWNTLNVINMSVMFYGATKFNQPINTSGNYWNTTNVSNMRYMFYNAKAFNQPIGNWNTTNVTNMSNMFAIATAFNQPINTSGNNWNTTNVTNMSYMFQAATSFNQNIGTWDVSKVTNMSIMFQQAGAFNNGGSSTISSWSAPLCADFNQMFATTSSFNQPLTNLVQTSNVSTNMQAMFSTASAFNQNIGTWDVSKVTTMQTMFASAGAFNNGGSSTISSWSAPLCSSFNSMFAEASSFNQPLTNLLQTSNVSTNMQAMFRTATLFNQNIGTWDVSKVTTMGTMFNNATAFKQNISNWTPYACTDMSNMFLNVDINNPNSATNQTNYNALLNSWGTDPKLSLLKNNVPFHAGSSIYTISTAGTARSNLIGKGWTITDGGGVSVPSAPTITTVTPTNNQIAINFTVPTSNGGATITSYKYSLDNGSTFATAVQTTSPITVTGLAYNTTYQVIIRAVNSAGDGTISNMVSVTTPITGSLNYSFTYTGTGLTEQLVLDKIPIKTLAGKFTITSSTISIVSTAVNVTIVTSLYVGSTTTEFGITFNFSSLTTFYNNSTSNLTFISSNNCPFSKNGFQFANLNNAFYIQSGFVPYFLSGTSLNSCFYSCTNFNSNIGSWNTQSVTDMSNMFYYDGEFNNGDLTNAGQNPLNWDTTNVTNMSNMFFYNRKFNQYINFSNTLSVTNMNYMFTAAEIFNNGELSNTGSNPLNLNTTNVTTMFSMFESAYTFNQPIYTSGNYWNTSKVTNMAQMLRATQFFNQPIGNWDTSSVTTMNYMFNSATKFNQPIGNWNTSNVTTMIHMFNNASVFNNGDLTNAGQNPLNWDTTKVTTMESMFYNAIKFNQFINFSNTSNVTTMISMFYGMSIFNNGEVSNTGSKPLNLNTTNVTTMELMFTGASAFNQPINASGNYWNTSNVTTMKNMFRNASAFNQNIGSWIVSKVTIMEYMFGSAFAFNQPIGNWNTSSVIYMNGMFATASSFNQPLGNWNTSNVITINQMFHQTPFNQPINTSGNYWNTSKVVDMVGVFWQASSFNQPIDLWNTVNVTSMDSMFREATSFKQNISSWTPNACTSMSYMFYNADMNNPNSATNQNNYNALLNSWGNNPLLKNGVRFDTLSKYTISIAGTARSNLTTSTGSGGKGWVIYDGGGVSVPSAPTINTITQIDNQINNQITINFTVPTSNGGATITSYKYSLDNGSTFATVVTTTSPITVTGLAYNTTYQVIIRAVNSVGDGTISNMVSVTTPITGSLNYSFTYTGTGLTQQLVIDNIPIKTLAGKFTITSSTISIVSTAVNVTIVTSLYVGSTTTEFGITFNFNSLTTFYNGSTSNLTFISSNNCPLSRNGFQFSGLTQAFSIQSGVVPYFLSGTSLESCFSGCTNFNSNISNWDTTNVTDMNYMFINATAFNNGETTNTGSNPLNLNTTNVTSMFAMFDSATTFNQPINTSGNYWNTSKVTNMDSMFYSATAFNQNIGNWNPSNVTTMESMFAYATAFNNGETTNTGSNPLNWNTSNVTKMEYMFNNATAFNQSINTSGNYWNTSNVTGMVGLFFFATAFNNPIGNWNTTNVVNMEYMFCYATEFNQPIDNWNVSNVTLMNYMFLFATNFKQNISNWTPYACTDMDEMFGEVDINNPNSATNQTNYNALLNSWGTSPKLSLVKNNVPFGAGLSIYTISSAGTARSNLIGKGWTITDGGGV